MLSEMVRRGSNDYSLAIIPRGAEFEPRIKLTNASSIQSVELIIRSKILGINTISANPPFTTITIPLLQVEPGVYTAKIATPRLAGTYEILIKITDVNGNIIEQQVARIKVLSPLLVLESGSNLPLTDARILLSAYDKQTNSFKRIRTSNNPGFTDAAGQLSMLLPPGSYKAETSALGYAPKTVTFMLGEKDGQEYPVIYLKTDPFNIIALLTYLFLQSLDSLIIVINALSALINSPRFFGFMASTALGSFVSLSFLFFVNRTAIRWKDLFPFFMFNILAVAGKHHKVYLHGWIIDMNQKAVSEARIDAVAVKTGTVLAHTFSNKEGKFVLRNTFKERYIKLVITKDSYSQAEHIIPTDTEKALTVNIAQHSVTSPAVIGGFNHLSAESFEFSLLLCLVAELIFLLSFGVAKTLPFFILSIINILLWIFFQRQKKL